MKQDLQLERHIEALRRHVRVLAWRVPAVDAGFAELKRRHAERHASRTKVRTIGGAAIALAASVLLVFGLVGGLERGSTHDVSALLLPSERVDLGDDMQVRFEHGAAIDVVERTPERVSVRLNKGAAEFAVRHEPKRLFRVEAGDVSIEDRGTVFTVKRSGGEVDVAVTEGAVEVSFTLGDRRRRVTLVAGQRGSYIINTAPTTAVGPAPDEAGEAIIEPTVAQPVQGTAPGSDRDVGNGNAPKAHDPTAAKAVTQLPAPAMTASTRSMDLDWRQLARAGEHQAAHALLARAGFDVPNTPADLLLASDVARRALHPADAVPLLRRLLANHAGDARAPSAAFTLGWVLMSELGRNSEGAAAFERAVALAPKGTLAQDASARAVEAWQRAGETIRAKRQLEAYRKHYPNGRHLERLQRMVGTP